jgi:hypothetical protein
MNLLQETANTVSAFESQVWRGDRSGALACLLAILKDMAKSGGGSPDLVEDRQVVAESHAPSEVAATRLAAAVAELFSNPDFELSEPWFYQLMTCHRWLALVFNASSFGNSDFVLDRAGLETSPEFIRQANQGQLYLLALFYGAESRHPINFTELFHRSPPIATSLAICILSSRLLATNAAHQKREILLKWAVEALAQLKKLDGLPLPILVDLWMHTSYGLDRDKHDLKKPLNKLLRIHMADRGYVDPPIAPRLGDGKPTVFVFLEWFHKTHSIMRTHSLSMVELKEHYRLVGFGPQGMVDKAGSALFDDFHYFEEFSGDLKFLKPIYDLVERERPVATYMPSVGMGMHSLFLINLRLAPKQIIALGHPATTHSDKIDHVLVEEDYLGDPDLFSEDVVRVPKNALPYFKPDIKLEIGSSKQRAPVKIAVPTAVMKLNPVFLTACRRVVERTSAQVEFHFLLGGAPELLYRFAKRIISEQVPAAIVHKTAPRAAYMNNVKACDIFANPFPFGNTNGIVDTVYCGLPGVCLIGDEVHEHIDKGMFTRMGFPEWTITYTVDEYVVALIRLVDDDALRSELSQKIVDEQWDEVLYKGDPSAFSDKFMNLVTDPEQLTGGH